MYLGFNNVPTGSCFFSKFFGGFYRFLWSLGYDTSLNGYAETIQYFFSLIFV